MSEAKTIDVEITNQGAQMGLQVSQAGAVGRALGMDELKANLDFIRDVMKNVMREGQDYGKIPGTGDKPTLLQPGAQKLLMTFQLTEYVKKEVLREYPGMHREYEFTLTIKAQNGKEWDGIGTCSTFEKKYRYRQGGRKCPRCGKATILSARKGPPGFFCWSKKGGCGEKFDINDPTIINQSEQGQVENPDIADQWNTVRKIAFKRALVSAAINATNTSELWTQDLDDKAPEDPGDDSHDAPGPRRGSQTPPPRQPATQPRASAAPAPAPKTVPYADENTRGKMLRQFEDHKVLTEFFVKIGWLLPNSETVEDLALRYVPITKRQADTLGNCFKNFKDGGDAVAPYPPNPEKPVLTGNDAKGPEKPPPNVPHGKEQKPVEVPRDPNPDPNSPDAPWRAFPVPYGRHAGTKLADLDKKVLYGFWANMEVETEYQGRPRKPEQIARDQTFRDFLDEAGQHYEFTKRDQDEPARSTPTPDSEYAPAEPEDDNVPF